MFLELQKLGSKRKFLGDRVTVERDIISELVTGASAAERAFADHLLAAGTAAGWSCAELLERVRGQT